MNPVIPEVRSQNRFILISHGNFFLTGVATTMLGPLLPVLIQRWAISDSQAGALFAAQAGGALCGTALGTAWSARFGFLRTLTMGAAAMAAGAAGLISNWLVLGFLAAFVTGLGIGMSIPTSNLLISQRFSTRRSAALNLLNLAWCVGAVVGPLLIALALKRGSEFFLLPLGGLLLLSAWFLHEEHRREPYYPESPASGGNGSAQGWWRGPLLFGLLLFLYVSTEVGFVGWVPTYAKRLGGLVGSYWFWLQSTFWFCLLLVRALFPFLLERYQPSRLVMAALVVTLLGQLVFLSAGASILLFVGVAIVGLGLSVIYPTTVAVYSALYGTASSKSSGLVFMMASLGGALAPWLVGLISDVFNDLHLALMVLIGTTLAMILLQGVILRLTRSQNA